jgi:hypothetical protein
MENHVDTMAHRLQFLELQEQISVQVEQELLEAVIAGVDHSLKVGASGLSF